ncbi:MAG: LytR/AlgR family response regulator transcription factor [Desulfitobacteriia bacterium]|jgi:DNA-binding LytR/AlgR family response regulator
MIKAVLVDDEEMALEELAYALEQFENLNVLKTFSDPLEFLKELPNCQPDVIFLDIEMPEVNGFVVCEEILAHKPDILIVFVTAYDEYAIKAFEANALDYVLKPVDMKRLQQTIKKIVSRSSENSQERPCACLPQPDQYLKSSMNKIIVWENEEIILLKPSSVLYFKVQDGSVLVVTEQKKYKTRNTLNYWEQRLSKRGFFRCHKSFLINIDKIEKIVPMFNNTFILRLTNHREEIPVSRNGGKALKRVIGI